MTQPGRPPAIPETAGSHRYAADMRRRCARPDCAEAASVTLSYDYGSATVWIEPLTADDHPMTHDLCERHGARTAPPRGWDLVDRRRMPASIAS